MDKLKDTLLSQCEKQAEKLNRIAVDDTFMAELDIFDSYFDQLKQVLNADFTKQNKERIDNLQKLMELFKRKIENAMKTTMAEIKNTTAKKQSIGYGAAKTSEAVKFDKRS